MLPLISQISHLLFHLITALFSHHVSIGEITHSLEKYSQCNQNTVQSNMPRSFIDRVTDYLTPLSLLQGNFLLNMMNG